MMFRYSVLTRLKYLIPMFLFIMKYSDGGIREYSRKDFLYKLEFNFFMLLPLLLLNYC